MEINSHTNTVEQQLGGGGWVQSLAPKRKKKTNQINYYGVNAMFR